MLGVGRNKTKTQRDPASVLEALDGVFCVIEFDVKGKILTANAQALTAFGYTKAELIGKSHEVLVWPDYPKDDSYAQFWSALVNGGTHTNRVSRFNKSGARMWFEAVYVPLKDQAGNVQRILFYGTDMTEEMEETVDNRAKLKSIGASQAVIEFTPEGRILAANNNFCEAMGYTEQELIGREHRIFAPDSVMNAQEYDLFWQRLRDRKQHTSEITRIRKDGTEIYLHASYSPIINNRDELVKVVKFATDTSRRRRALDAIAAGVMRVRNGDLRSEITETFDPEI
ncbi:MAG: PAS domain-containing protein, partial [Pseudomonadota bacterium]